METFLLAFDEPTAGLSKDERLTVAHAFKSLLDKRHTIVVVSHDLEFFLPLCDRVFVISEGEVKHENSPSGLLAKSVLLRQWGVQFPLSYRLQKLIN
jgi:energy-coupling factor transporter ATP-binding protein EcfA2